MSKKANDAAGARPVIAREEYDFSDVPKDELRACLINEYARESRAARDEIAAARKQRKKSKGETQQVKFGPRVQHMVHSHILMYLSLSSGFPNAPWQHLSEKDKQNLLRMNVALPRVFRYAETWHNPPLTFALNKPGITTLDMWMRECRKHRPTVADSEPIKFGFFTVNLKYGYQVLIEEFIGYLRHFEGKPMLEFPPLAKKSVQSKPPGRQSIHDGLKALGAMRLRYYCKRFVAAKAKMKPLRDKPNGMFYAHRESFNRACDTALRHFQKLFGWLDSAKPIHFTKP